MSFSFRFFSNIFEINSIDFLFLNSQIATQKWSPLNQRRRLLSIQSSRSAWTKKLPTITNSHWKTRKLHACAVHQTVVERSINSLSVLVLTILNIISHSIRIQPFVSRSRPSSSSLFVVSVNIFNGCSIAWYCLFFLLLQNEAKVKHKFYLDLVLVDRVKLKEKMDFHSQINVCLNRWSNTKIQNNM